MKLSDQEPVVSYAMSYFTQLGDLLKKTDRRYINKLKIKVRITLTFRS